MNPFLILSSCPSFNPRTIDADSLIVDCQSGIPIASGPSETIATNLRLRNSCPLAKLIYALVQAMGKDFRIAFKIQTLEEQAQFLADVYSLASLDTSLPETIATISFSLKEHPQKTIEMLKKTQFSLIETAIHLEDYWLSLANALLPARENNLELIVWAIEQSTPKAKSRIEGKLVPVNQKKESYSIHDLPSQIRAKAKAKKAIKENFIANELKGLF